MSALAKKLPKPPVMDREVALQSPPPQSWEGICDWLTNSLKGMETTIERQEAEGDRVIECLSHPLERVATHQTPNGVQIISIDVGMDGKRRRFEIPGPTSVMLCRNAAGWPVKVEIGYEEGRLVLRFSGPGEPQKRQSSNAWGE